MTTNNKPVQAPVNPNPNTNTEKGLQPARNPPPMPSVQPPKQKK